MNLQSVPWLERAIEAIYAARRRLATAAVAMLAVLLGWHVLFGANGMVTYEHKRAEYRQLESQIDDLQKENQQLQQQVEKLRSDPETIEREAREQLRYARPGEVIFTLPAAPAPNGQRNLKAQK